MVQVIAQTVRNKATYSFGMVIISSHGEGKGVFFEPKLRQHLFFTGAFADNGGSLPESRAGQLLRLLCGKPCPQTLPGESSDSSCVAPFLC